MTHVHNRARLMHKPILLNHGRVFQMLRQLRFSSRLIEFEDHATLHFAIRVFGAGFDKGDFLWGKVEQLVDDGVEARFLDDDLLR